MKVCNRMNLPKAIVEAAQSSIHSPKIDSYSVTELLNSPRAIILTRRHWDELEQDVSDMTAALFGTAVHKMLEEHSDANSEIPVSTRMCGVRFAGRIDAYNEAESEIIDYKTCTCSKILNEDFDDWKKQGLMYAWLLFKTSECSIKPKKLRFVAFLKDWSKMKNLTVPPICEWTYVINDSDYDWIEAFIKDKLATLAECEALSDGNLPECTTEERWNEGNKWAVYKDAQSKRALRLCATESEAKELYPDCVTIKRSGRDIKCSNYCVCSKFCKRKEKE